MLLLAAKAATKIQAVFRARSDRKKAKAEVGKTK